MTVLREVLARFLLVGTLLFVAHLAWGRSGQPNVIFLLADDLGYAELGSYGQTKIRTPHLDRMAAGGMRFTQHYAGSPVCAPARCVLMTGMHPGKAHVRDNLFVPPEGQAPIPADSPSLAKVFKKAGYTTGAFGKWGLGPVGSSGDPLKQGFDRFFGYNCQKHAHSLYPTYLWDGDRRRPLNNPEYPLKQKLPPESDPNDPASYLDLRDGEYAPDLYSEEARRFIRDNKDRPFFLFYPTVIPHLPLQVPEDSLKEYEGLWPDPPYVGGYNYEPHRTPRAAYAAMVTRMDRQIGRMMDLVVELGLDENTIFVFTSDNGPTFNRLGGSDSEFFESAGPFRGFKGSIYEGGIRVPLIVRWKGRIEPNSVSDRVTGFEDWMATLAELVGAQFDSAATDGISFAPTLFGKGQPERPFLYREFAGFGGQQSVRWGNWKGVRQDLLRQSPDSLKTELYNLAEDPGETRDVSADHPKIVALIERLMREERVPSEIFPIPSLDRSAKSMANNER